jgi:hypothetical protein
VVKRDDLRRLAAKCRALADMMVSQHDEAALRKVAADFDLQADQLGSDATTPDSIPANDIRLQ